LPAADLASFFPRAGAASARFVAEPAAALFAAEFFAAEVPVAAFVDAAPLATESLAASARPAGLDAAPLERRDVAALVPFVFSFFLADDIRKTLLQASRCGDGTNYRSVHPSGTIVSGWRDHRSDTLATGAGGDWRRTLWSSARSLSM
jgi:hypothetical protein